MKAPFPWFGLPANIASKIRLGGSGCWEWTAATTDGYGIIAVKRKPQRAHRVIYEILRGPIPVGVQESIEGIA